MEHQIGDASEMNQILQELFKERLLLSLGQLTKDEFEILMSQFATSKYEDIPTDSNLILAAFRKESSGINNF